MEKYYIDIIRRSESLDDITQSIDSDEFTKYIYHNNIIDLLEELMDIDIFKQYIIYLIDYSDHAVQYIIFTVSNIDDMRYQFISYTRNIICSMNNKHEMFSGMINSYHTNEDYIDLIYVFEKWNVYLTRYDIMIMEMELYSLLSAVYSYMRKSDLDMMIGDESIPITTYPLIL